MEADDAICATIDLELHKWLTETLATDPTPNNVANALTGAMAGVTRFAFDTRTPSMTAETFAAMFAFAAHNFWQQAEAQEVRGPLQ